VVTYNGVVRRSDGKSTVWINGNPITERSTSNPEINLLNVRRDGAVSIAVPQADRTASLKVGQSLEVTSGTIEESYARRATIPKATKSHHPCRSPPKVLEAPGATRHQPTNATTPTEKPTRRRHRAPVDGAEENPCRFAAHPDCQRGPHCRWYYLTVGRCWFFRPSDQMPKRRKTGSAALAKAALSDMPFSCF
jgi:hypothetical protein